MSSIIRPLTASASRASTKQLSGARAFHTPYALLGESPLAAASTSSNAQTYHYEKQYDYTHEPFISTTGRRTYVVSEPDASFKYYQVPAGAYPTSSPYINFAPGEAPQYSKADVSSTAADILAHPFTTRAAPRNARGVGESSAVRHGAAPGAMGRRGGSYGGMKLMDREGTKPGVGRLGDRNPQPDSQAAEKFSKGGVQNAWKMRI